MEWIVIWQSKIHDEYVLVEKEKTASLGPWS